MKHRVECQLQKDMETMKRYVEYRKEHHEKLAAESIQIQINGDDGLHCGLRKAVNDNDRKLSSRLSNSSFNSPYYIPLR